MKSNIITLVGMSGVGKSYWSDKFKSEGFQIYAIDDLISKELGNIISKTKGDKNVAYVDSLVGELAKWMGFPGDKRYEKNCKTYLKLEEKITLKALNQALKSKAPTIIDTTGSVIYLSQALQKKIKKQTSVIYLATNKSKLEEMFKTFCSFPKPIIWNGLYKALKNEKESETLERCYKKLLEFRSKKYNKLAHKVLEYKFHHKKGLDTAQFLKKVEKTNRS